MRRDVLMVIVVVAAVAALIYIWADQSTCREVSITLSGEPTHSLRVCNGE